MDEQKYTAANSIDMNDTGTSVESHVYSKTCPVCNMFRYWYTSPPIRFEGGTVIKTDVVVHCPCGAEIVYGKYNEVVRIVPNDSTLSEPQRSLRETIQRIDNPSR